MSSKKLKLKIFTPEKLLLETVADQVTLPTNNGVITILPRHVPIIAKLHSGDIVAKEEGEYIPFAVTGGFIEVKRNGVDTEVNILADFAEHVADLTGEKIAEARARAEKIKQQIDNKEIVDFEHFETELERSLTSIKIADKWGSRKYRK